MTFDYESIRDNVVEPQLANFGKEALLTQPGTPTGDEWDPTPGTPVEYPSRVLEVDFTVTDRTGTLVKEKDIKFMLSTANSPSPDLGGTLLVGDDTFQVISLKPKRPGSTLLFWYVHCRK